MGLAVGLGRAMCLVLAATTLPGVSRAQTVPVNPPLPPAIGSAGPASIPSDRGATVPSYEPDLERLAERLGTLAFMRRLCRAKDADEWHKRMAALLDTEGGSPLRREQLAGAYNRGFRGYQATYRTCTPAAHLVIARALAEGDRLSRELEARFGGT